MKKLNLYLVESPLQLINAMEAASLRMDAENHLCIMLSGREKSDAQIMRLARDFSWSEIIYEKIVKISSLLDLISIVFSHYKLALNLKKKYRKKEICIFIGEFRSYWMHLITSLVNPTSKYLLDDGDITISIQEKYLQKNKSHPFRLNTKIKNAIKTILYFPVFIRYKKKQWHLFTTFELTPAKNQIIEKNKYSYASNEYHLNKIETDLIYYFGSKYSEANILDQATEIDFLKKAFSFYSKEHIRYIPHRDDSIEKLDIIRHLGIKVLEIELPAEIYLLQSKNKPRIISGGCTTVLNNAKRILPEIKIQSFLLPLNQIKKIDLREDIENSYRNLSELGIEIIDPQLCRSLKKWR